MYPEIGGFREKIFPMVFPNVEQMLSDLPYVPTRLKVATLIWMFSVYRDTGSSVTKYGMPQNSLWIC